MAGTASEPGERRRAVAWTSAILHGRVSVQRARGLHSTAGAALKVRETVERLRHRHRRSVRSQSQSRLRALA